MPLISDYDKDEEQGGGPGPGSGAGPDIGTGGGGGAAASDGGNATRSGGSSSRSSPQHEEQFVPWSRIQGANQSVAQRESDRLKGQVTGDVGRAKGELDAARGAFGMPPSEPVAARQRGSLAMTGAAPERDIQQKASGLGIDADVGAPEQKGPAQAWASFGLGNAGDEAAQGMIGGASPMGQRAMDKSPLGQTMLPGMAAGPRDLGEAIGSKAWQGLLGDTTRAAQEANALGSEAGVQGLLEQNTGNSTGFDAALVGGAGGKGFRDIAKQSGGDKLINNVIGSEQQAIDRWSKLRGDMAARQPGPSDAGNGAAVDEGRGPKDETREETLARVQQLETLRGGAGRPATTGYQNYTGGRYGNVITLGTQQQMLDALTSNTAYGDGVKWDNSPTVAENVATATRALGMDQNSFIEAIKRMNPTEYTDFWLLGVVPRWMQVGQGAEVFNYGGVGGWKSPFLEAVLGFNQNGMWNAITDMWANSAKTAAAAVAGGPAGAVGAGVNAVDKGARKRN